MNPTLDESKIQLSLAKEMPKRSSNTYRKIGKWTIWLIKTTQCFFDFTGLNGSTSIEIFPTLVSSLQAEQCFKLKQLKGLLA